MVPSRLRPSVPHWEMAESNSSFSSACHWNNVPPPPTLLALVTRIISPCALGTPKHLALATLSLSSSNTCYSCGPERQVVLFLIKSVRTALV